MQEAKSSQVRYLILNADDFGYSEEVNAAVLRARAKGSLTSASLMVTEPAWEQAVEIARNTPGLGVGLHVCISLDHSILTSKQIPKLVGPNGRFGADPFRVGLRYALSRNVKPQLLLEMEAQFKRFASTGLTWSHADAHQHFHLHPTVWGHFIDLCDSHSVQRIRLPHEPVLRHLKSGGDRSGANIAGLLAFQALRKRAKRDLENRSRAGRRYFVCDKVYGMLQTGNMNRAYLTQLVTRLDGTTNEIYFHPGSPHASRIGDGCLAANDVELDALVNPDLKALAASHSILMGSYSEVDLMQAKSSAICAESRSNK